MKTKFIGLLLGLFSLLFTIISPVPEGLTREAYLAGGIALLMAFWWLTEVVPIYVTAFIPLALFPLSGLMTSGEVAENYSHNNVLMLLGGMIIAKAIEAQNLHKRIALVVITFIGVSRTRIILSFMVATAFLSMWIANVAVALMMLPIATAVIDKEESSGNSGRFGLALMLAIAYSASIGGMASLVGTPPNLIFSGIVESMYPQAPSISFTDWLMVGVPIALVLLPISWFYLLKFFGVKGTISSTSGVIAEEMKALGTISKAEARVLAIFIFTVVAWIFRKDLNLGSLVLPGWGSLLGIGDYVHEATVAFISILLLFVISNGNKQTKARLLDWKTVSTVPWGVVMIVGGGYALAKSFNHTGLAEWLGNKVSFLQGMPTFVVLILIIFFITFLTEINSNTATANIFMPILATVAIANQSHPFLLMIPATFACSAAFCLPSGTGTNAVVFASERLTISEMARAGFWMNFIAIVVITLMTYFIAVPYFELSNTVPLWVER
ncbi:SLC13 family permease [Xanthovirga aplysinae]|uniref:SLC13 family permease n=1 Tax=Xanthovirga aplysinae TaxID=2529853 RepID=UPI0012BB69E0|nr:SLC13 family permease [Xanthovirga aplysinae]MTI33476.1 SLC13/DASS family transporter [Xanthovirga aplysinae]